MISSRKPERFFSAHALKAYDDILDGEHHRVPDVQRPRGVWRRQNDRERFVTVSGKLIGIVQPAVALRFGYGVLVFLRNVRLRKF